MSKTTVPATPKTASKDKTTRICWTFKNPNGEPFMQIRAYTTELCYQLWEWGETKRRTGEIEWEWKPLDCYPWSLQAAVLKVMNYMVERCGGATDDVRKMAATIKKIETTILEGVNNEDLSGVV